jgi:hypothetical protein
VFRARESAAAPEKVDESKRASSFAATVPLDTVVVAGRKLVSLELLSSV